MNRTASTIAGSRRPAWRRAAVATVAACLALGFAAAAAPGASAAPAWSIKARWGDTNLPPGGKAAFLLFSANVGTAAGSGTVTITDELPEGVTIEAFEVVDGEFSPQCTGVGTATATCTFPAGAATSPPLLSGPTSHGHSTPAPSGDLPTIAIEVAVGAGAQGTGLNVATISGGGAASAATDEDPVAFGAVPSPFGFVPGSFEMGLFDAERPAGEIEKQAGAHPYEMRVEFDLNQNYGEAEGPSTFPAGKVRTVDALLPRGIVGNPEATPKCRLADFATTGVVLNSTQCPADTQVGYANINFSNTASDHGYAIFKSAFLRRVAIYNLVPPKGQVADFGFAAGGLVSAHIYPTVDAGADYAIRTLTPSISNLISVRDVQVTFWGVPADPAHDRVRYYPNPTQTAPAIGAPFGSAPIRPLLTNPMDCGVDNGTGAIRADSWSRPNQFTPTVETGDHLIVEGCEDPRIRFEPDVALQPTSRAAGGPTGLQVDLAVPQRSDAVLEADELYPQSGDVQAIPTPPLKKVVVTLPEGMTISTSAAQGLGSCTLAQIGLGTNDPVTCPDSSQYGTLTLHTPILPRDEPMRGFIYIARQDENPFGDFLAMYFVIEEPQRGLRVKIPGHIELDPATGQIKATLDDLPQFPVSDVQLNLKGGVRAALVNPATCGTKEIRAEFFSWAAPGTPEVRTSSYSVSEKADGSPCVKSLGERPFHPDFTAGTLNPSAGAYSPFVLRLTRTDDDQEFSQLGATLPPGLIAKIAGLSRCGDAAIAQAEAAGRSGMIERLFPSCPASSEIGATDVGSGVGQVITYLPGKAYLAGPYKGAPLSMVVITPVVAGPYDLGTISVRTRISLNPRTAQVSARTDPFPQIYRGIPVRLRDIRLKLDRPQTILNPTNCDPASVTAEVTGTGADLSSTADDTTAALLERFQAANCAALGFKPRLSISLRGRVKRGGFPSLRAELRTRPGDANIAAAAVSLPRSAFLAQAHIRTICTRAQFAAGACPKGAIYGRAEASTPLLDEPLKGNVYLRSSSHRLPDLVVALHGPESLPIEVEVASRVDSARSRIRSSFIGLPDVPVTRFVLTMQGGRKGLLENSENLCHTTRRALVEMTGQNGKPHDFRPKVTPLGCKKANKKQQDTHRPGRGASR